MRFVSLLLVFVLLVIGCQKAPQETAKWETLFDGQSLAGWKTLGGEADFFVADGMLVGNSELGAPNVFLCTEKAYSDFILEYDVKIDKGINSGMQIRSSVWDEEKTTDYVGGNGEKKSRTWKPGTVWGYQIELDPTDRAWSGGFYEEGGRGWLVTLAENADARSAFKKGDWNSFKIKAEGNHFQTWVNGVLAVDTIDDESTSGFLGLQLHSIKKEEQVGKKVWWKNIRIQEL